MALWATEKYGLAISLVIFTISFNKLYKSSLSVHKYGVSDLYFKKHNFSFLFEATFGFFREFYVLNIYNVSYRTLGFESCNVNIAQIPLKRLELTVVTSSEQSTKW